ncbi:hypothetical protein ARMGADRAFT_612257 [Armillaria gallica]|uniref:Uncharacterized protein n=1 Tax=Armillaria gallica TaxID=47427 RepID=A0A2H3CMB4_ARMGA|nr:hypothetical protein ARMGADRAFT_612257 [Armillaria gallica]
MHSFLRRRFFDTCEDMVSASVLPKLSEVDESFRKEEQGDEQIGAACQRHSDCPAFDTRSQIISICAFRFFTSIMPRTIESLTKENERLSNAIVDLQVQRDKYRQQVGKKRQELGKLQSEKERVDCEVTDLRRRVSDLEERLADSRAAPLAAQAQGSEHIALETVLANKEAPTPGFAETDDEKQALPSTGPSSIKNQNHLNERAIEIPSDSSDFEEFSFLSPRTPAQKELKEEHKQVFPKVIVSAPHIRHRVTDPVHTHGLQGHNSVPVINFARPTMAKLRFYKRPSSLLNNPAHPVLKRRKISSPFSAGSANVSSK